MNYDNSVVLNLNPFFLLEDDPTPSRNLQVPRATSLIISSLSFVRAIRKEELEPDMVRGVPLCMHQYTRLFGTARIPTEHGCVMAVDSKSKHVVVLCRSQFYWFDVLDENSDVVITEKALSTNLEAIIADANSIPVRDAAKSAVGVLSTEHRRIWAGLREHLLSDGDGEKPGQTSNREALQIVDSALFIVCLDDSNPEKCATLCSNMVSGSYRLEEGVQIGTCSNRWYDKMQIIVCQNGSAGINFEHTGVDGHTVLRFVSDIYTDTVLRFAKSINPAAPTLWKSTSPDPAKRDPHSLENIDTVPHKLEWRLTPELSTGIRFAETRLSDLILQNEVEVLEFQGYGKSFITSVGFSPDAFVQMAFQAAYYGLYGRFEVTYEPSMTKTFLHGRTEAIYVVGKESQNYVRNFWGDVSPSIKAESLKRACEAHVARTKTSSQAQGHHRHLYALFCMWQRGVLNGDLAKSDSSRTSGSANDDMPSIFADSGWEKLNDIILSTSNCGNPSLRMFGFGPVSGDGFGIGYIIKENGISICASSKHRQTARFLSVLQSYLLEIKTILRTVYGRPRRRTMNRNHGNQGGGGRLVNVSKLMKEEEEEEVLGNEGCKFLNLFIIYYFFEFFFFFFFFYLFRGL